MILYSSIIVALLCLIVVCCARIGEWHRTESQYWYGIAMLVTVDPDRDPYYQSLLLWSRNHKPSLLEKVRGWRSPEMRRAAA